MSNNIANSSDLLDGYDDNGSSSPIPAIEIVMLSVKECFVYKVPPLRQASGHRAEEWDLANPIFTGCLRVYQADTKLRILIYGFKDQKKMVMSDEDMVLFGECPIELKSSNDTITNFVDGVIDSSRYYVVRIKDPKSNRTTNIGIGFRERELAFDFKNCLNEYIRYIDRLNLANKITQLTHDFEERRLSGDFSSSSPSVDGGNDSDGDHTEHEASSSSSSAYATLSSSQTKKDQVPQSLLEHISPLKEGEKIKVKLNVHKKTASEGDESLSSKSTKEKKESSSFSLKPPPVAGSTVFSSLPVPSNATTESNTNNAKASGVDDEWGDFSSG